jgi:hypothetical protein
MIVFESQQVRGLLRMIASVEPADIGCDECYGRVSEYAEWQLLRQPLPEGMRAIESHLRQCPCCRDEYAALLEGLREIEGTE